MHNQFHFRSAAIALMLFSASVALPSVGYCKSAKTAFNVEKAAITTTLRRELSRATPDHVKISRFNITSIDVSGYWSLANVKPRDNQGLDPISVLLHKVSGKWKVVTLGTNLLGAGKQYNVPRSLWKRWQLGL
ncbi:hypothetical protein IAD21_04785 [Abditibacteriota bacterium]|nr:hypothetical protein IAD21_04785 [Abditibacteriota bacterium]